MRQTKFCFPLIILSAEDNYRGSWPTQVDPIYEDTIIHAQYEEAIPVPTQPTSPDEIMSGGEGEPVEADVPAEDETARRSRFRTWPPRRARSPTAI